MELLEQIADQLEKGQAATVAQLTTEAISAEIPAAEILNGGLIAGMDLVGEKFRKHEVFLPHVLLAAKAMHAGMELIKPLLMRDGVRRVGKAVLGTVRGDQHDIGKNLVGIMLEGAGFEVLDLGTDVAPERFVEAALAGGATVIGMSALLTTTMPVMREVIELINERELRGRLRTVIGGAPVTEDYAREIGADAYAFDGVSAVDRIRDLVAGGPGLLGGP
ncbi:MAG: corrinoid protein [Gemmatimonadales bacterium]|nr:corrinoid protein [Gemmatimonadales bacterium]